MTSHAARSNISPVSLPLTSPHLALILSFKHDLSLNNRNRGLEITILRPYY